MPSIESQKENNQAYLTAGKNLDCPYCGHGNLVDRRMAFNGQFQPFKCCHCFKWLLMKFNVDVELVDVDIN